MENQIILIDTCVLIEHFRKGSDQFEYYCNLQDEQKVSLAVSVITVFEYYSGITLNNIFLLQKADELFETFEIYDVNQRIAKTAAKINNQFKLSKKIGTADLFIAATALYLDAQLLTLNKRHFRCIPGLKFA